MHIRIPTLAVLVVLGIAPAAATSLPAFETYSAAANFGTRLFLVDPTPITVPQVDVTGVAGATAQINGTGYTASASTTLGSNHTFTGVSALPPDVPGAASFSGWYDRVVISGGSGTGTATFTVQLSGTVDVGAYGGSLSYTLGTSSVHPSQLPDGVAYFNATPSAQPWPLDATQAVTTYLLGASPYNDTSVLFASAPATVPAITGTSGPLPLGDAEMEFPAPDRILTPGSGQAINLTLQGTLNFTYGETFYLIGGLGAFVGDGIESYCAFETPDCVVPKDGSGATTFDFSNSANLVGLELPQGARFTASSGAAYTVTAVPEPGEWLMLLAGLGLVGWRVARRDG